MANELKETVLSFSERQLKLLKMYLPYVVIVALGYGYWDEHKEVKRLTTKEAVHLEKDLEFAQDAYQKTNETYYFIIKELKNEKQNQGR